MSWGLIRVQDHQALVFSYVDPQAGPSAKGALLRDVEPTSEDVRDAATRPTLTVRLGPGLQPRPLPVELAERLTLPAEPEWLAFFRPGPPGPWTKDPLLAEHFHADCPDDVSALFFLAGTGQVERMWVRLDREVPAHQAWGGVLLNTAHHDAALTQGTRVMVRGVPGAKGPLWLSPAMAKNLEQWSAKCEACGFDLVLEPVEVLIARQFKNVPAGESLVQLTTRCAMCRQTQLVVRREPSAPVDAVTPREPLPPLGVAVFVVLVLAALAFVAYELFI